MVGLTYVVAYLKGVVVAKSRDRQVPSAVLELIKSTHHDENFHGSSCLKRHNQGAHLRLTVQYTTPTLRWDSRQTIG